MTRRRPAKDRPAGLHSGLWNAPYRAAHIQVRHAFDVPECDTHPMLGGTQVPMIEGLYGTLRLATATTANIVRAIEKRPSRAAE